MIFNVVTGGADLPRDFRMALDVAADSEKSCANVGRGEDLEQPGRGGGGPIIEGERNGAAHGVAAPEGGRENAGGASADGPRRATHGGGAGQRNQSTAREAVICGT
jgi:hypothetical protein